MAELKARPTHDRIFATPIQQDERVGLIYIPDQARGRSGRAIVVAVGPGRWNEDTTARLPMAVHVGDKIVFGRHSGTEIPNFKFEDQTILIMREEEILAILQEGNNDGNSDTGSDTGAHT